LIQINKKTLTAASLTKATVSQKHTKVQSPVRQISVDSATNRVFVQTFARRWVCVLKAPVFVCQAPMALTAVYNITLM
jgi:hypothetical protein